MTYEPTATWRHLPVWFSALGACRQAPALSLAAGLGADIFHRQACVASAPLQAIKFKKGSELTESNLCRSCPIVSNIVLICFDFLLLICDKSLMKPWRPAKHLEAVLRCQGCPLQLCLLQPPCLHSLCQEYNFPRPKGQGKV